MTLLKTLFELRSELGKSKEIWSHVWLGEICRRFESVLHLFKESVLNNEYNTELVEIRITNIIQITKCLQYLERICKLNFVPSFERNVCWNYFLERMIQKVDNIVLTFEENNPPVRELSCFTIIDQLYDIISIFSKAQNVQDLPKMNEIELTEKERKIVSCLVSEIMSYADVTVDSDAHALKAMCKKVLREYNSLEEYVSLHKAGIKCYFFKVHLAAIVLENSLLRLEECISTSLLRLVLLAFTTKDFYCQELRSAVMRSLGKDRVKIAIQNFDSNLDRIKYLGLMAKEYAHNNKLKCLISSCLASFDDLKCDLIASIQCGMNSYFNILEEHFTEELRKFIYIIQNLIETKELCSVYIDMLTECIKANTPELKVDKIEEILKMGELVKENIKYNTIAMRKMEMENSSIHKTYLEFCVLLDECFSILACIQQVDGHRVLKRILILKRCLKNFVHHLNKSSYNENEHEAKPKILNSVQNSRSREISGKTKVPLIQINKRCSFRKSVLTKQWVSDIQQIIEPHTDVSLSLNLTAILNEITSLT